MPYIDKKNREIYNSLIDEIALKLNSSEQLAGDLNYVISRLCWQLCGYIPKEPDSRNMLIGERKYFQMNQILGAMEAAKFELYRKIVAPYEDKKILENGDI